MNNAYAMARLQEVEDDLYARIEKLDRPNRDAMSEEAFAATDYAKLLAQIEVVEYVINNIAEPVFVYEK